MQRQTVCSPWMLIQMSWCKASSRCCHQQLTHRSQSQHSQQAQQSPLRWTWQWGHLEPMCSSGKKSIGSQMRRPKAICSSSSQQRPAAAATLPGRQKPDHPTTLSPLGGRTSWPDSSTLMSLASGPFATSGPRHTRRRSKSITITLLASNTRSAAIGSCGCGRTGKLKPWTTGMGTCMWGSGSGGGYPKLPAIHGIVAVAAAAAALGWGGAV